MKKLFVLTAIILISTNYVNSQNKEIIDKVTGFDKYKFGLTKEELGCQYWLCTKHPDIKILDNNVIQVDLNFDYENNYTLQTIFIKLETNNGIFESLNKKYGDYRKELVNDILYRNVLFYLWEGDAVQIAYYEENGHTYVRYMKSEIKTINEL